MKIPDLQYVKLKTGQISYRQSGHGNDLVLLHGLAGNSRTWQKQFDFFSQNFRVTAWDAPGYGKSDIISAEINAYSESLNEFTNAIGIKTFILLGHSMGGIVAGHFSSQFPNRVSKLILSCTFLGRKQPKGSPLNKNYRLRLAQFDKMTPIDYGHARARSMTAPDCDLDILNDLAKIGAETRKEGLENAMRVISEADNGPSFASLNMPVLVLAGELDTTVTKNLTEAMVRVIPNSIPYINILYLKNVAHGPYMESPDNYNSALNYFLISLR
jgi:pimeloyl-ACP methyl ester carboxylesterase